VVVDRIILRPGASVRLANSIATALKLADGLVTVVRLAPRANESGEERLFSEKWACSNCGVSMTKLEPRSFSFNSRYGACETCEGLGFQFEFDPAKFITQPNRPLLEGGLGPASSNQLLRQQVQAFAASRRIPLDRPFAELSPRHRQLLVEGDGDFRGVKGHLQAWLEDTSMEVARDWLLGFTSPARCPSCQGARLRPESLAVQVGGRTISAFTALPISEAAAAASALEQGIQAQPRQRAVAGRLISEVRERLGFLLEVGLGYLSLDRPAATLSGGEAQRIRLAGQIGSRLRGVMYVLDEPSIGLHPRDNGRLLASLARLRDLGNTVLVVEHDRETIERADYMLDLGPGGGRLGGELVAQGTPAQVAAAPASLTGAYLAGRDQVPTPSARRAVEPGRGITVVGARAHNLRNLNVFFPAGVLTVLTGVSGAGKSTLVDDILYPALAARYFRALAAPAEHDRIEGTEHFDKVIRIDQDPIGRTPRSNAATYTGLLTPIRDLFAQLPESRARGYAPGRFSFNVRGGRCESCQGDGQKRIEMNFLPDVYVRCDVCRGRRYNLETLSVLFKGRSIADVLEATVEEARELFENVPQVRAKLDTLSQVGLGYIHLGQSATTVSGGEAQRIKLARELSRRQTGRTLYLLDEPTTGLHFEDVKHLLRVLQALVDLGKTVLVIEHNLDVIKAADWIIDLGPEGGAGGGRLVAQGTPEQVAKVNQSLTGKALKAAFSAQHSAVSRRPQAVVGPSNSCVKTALVTGSGGLIGSACAELLCREGWRVVGVDNDLRAWLFGPGGSTAAVVRALCEHRGYEHCNLDLRDRAGVAALVRRTRPQFIIHAAAQPSHDKAAEIPFADFDVNAGATLNLLAAARESAPEAPFCFTSSNKVYGDRPNQIALRELDTRWDYADGRDGIAEDCSVDQCLHSLFGASKLAADALCQEYGRYFGMPVGIFRGGCLTGPQHAGVALHGYLNYIVRCAVLGEPYRIHGHRGKQVRDQIHADDAAELFLQFFASPR